jgi:hypothetical protein
MERMIGEAESRNDYRTARERQATLDYLRKARDHYRRLAARKQAGSQ